jgi:hypothetical protein
MSLCPLWRQTAEFVIQAEREVAASFHHICLRQKRTYRENHFLHQRSRNVIENKGRPLDDPTMLMKTSMLSLQTHDVHEKKGGCSKIWHREMG